MPSYPYKKSILTALDTVTEPLINIDGHAIRLLSLRNRTGKESAEDRILTAVGVLNEQPIYKCNGKYSRLTLGASYYSYCIYTI